MDMVDHPSKVPNQVSKAMAEAAERWVSAQLQLRCLLHPGWVVTAGSFGYDLALINTKTGQRRTIEVKSRQTLPGLTRYVANHALGVDLFADRNEADYLVFVWFDHGLVYVLPTSGMAQSSVKGIARLRAIFKEEAGSPVGETARWNNAWDQLFVTGESEGSA